MSKEQEDKSPKKILLLFPYTCNKLEGTRKAFYGFYNGSLPNNCDQVFTEFFNLYFNTSFANYDSMQQWVTYNCNVTLNVCSASTDPLEITLRSMAIVPPALMPPRLCDAGPLFPTLIEPADTCNKFIQTLALNMGTEQYNIYLQHKRNEFDKKYSEKCLSAANLEIFTVTSQVAEYHYTLYYYDQAGSLVKTVPPAGVHEDFSTNFYNAVEAARVQYAMGNMQVVVPPHTLATGYRYNTLGQVVQQKSPDGGLSKFWYDRLGRLVVSQNAKQAMTNKYSYTKYDILGRIEEVGQLTNSSPITQTTSQDDGLLAGWMNDNGVNNTREQITVTKYDVPQDNPPLCGNPSLLCQKNLRNRVSYTYVQPTANYSNNNFPYTTATYYTYDIHGNVDTLLQHYNNDLMWNTANGFKRIEYKYDLISGKVNEVAYQPGVKDQFYHRYSYDAENKLTKVETSNDYVYWQQQAAYSYYRHGPLARTETGRLGVQGTDYVYTLQGWLKGVNSSLVIPTAGGISYDVGNDGINGARTARDAYGFSLNYNTTDYKSINNTVTPFSALANGLPQLNADGVNTGKNLYNGNIRAMLVNIPKLGDPANGGTGAKLYGYKYDQLNRIASMNAYSGLNTTNNSFTPVALDDYKERVSYDANGNILTYLRNGTTANNNPLAMDNMTYNYIANSNKLSSVNDAVAAGNYSTDIDNQGANNYDYDEIGNLTKDNAEGITSIEWTVYGKIKTINKNGGVTVNYNYDASGNRISKQVGSKTAFYVRDASGNVMAIYEKGNNEINSGKLSQIEVDLYGSSRLGMLQRNLDVESTNWWLFETTAMPGTNGGKMGVITMGSTTYELSNHLGNVLVTISDRKIQVQDPNNTTQTLYYSADVVTATDYYPFGSLMPGRKFSASGLYRYGFNGKENDNDVKGEGNQQDYGMRIYDPRLGRFLSVDPFEDEYPWNSPYSFAEGDPINFIDLDGAEKSKSEIQQIEKQNSPRLEYVKQNAYLALIALNGAKDAIINANSLGFTDWWGSTSNLNDYDTDEEKEAYLRGRISGNALACIQSIDETAGGLTTAVAGSETIVVGVGGLLVAGHGALVGNTAVNDIKWAFRKLNNLSIVGTAGGDASSSTNQQAQSAHQKNDNAANSNAAGTNSKQTTLDKNVEASKKSEEFVKQKLSKELKAGEEILEKPRIYIKGGKGKYANPDFVIYNRRTDKVTRIVDAKNGGATPSANQKLLNEKGGVLYGSKRYNIKRNDSRGIEKKKLETVQTHF